MQHALYFHIIATTNRSTANCKVILKVFSLNDI